MVEIIKANNHLENIDGTQNCETKRQKYIQSLKFRISTFYNNSCLDPQTPVLMWNGYIKKACEIKIGDELIGDDGNKRIVQYVCNGEDQMYEITQQKGNNYTVNSNHILSLKYSSHKKIFWLKPNKNYLLGAYLIKWYDNNLKKVKNKIVSVLKNRNKDQSLNIIKTFRDTINISDTFDIKVTDYLKLSKSVTRCFMGFKLNNSVNWEKKDVLLDPYILGMWLGDENSSCKRFNYHISDPEFNIGKYKFIPDDYLYNDTETRLKLLAGIIDTDGHVRENGTIIEISQSIKREKLIKQIFYLAKTLGFNSIINQKNVKKNGKIFKQVRVLISGYGINKIPTILKHKICHNPLERDCLNSAIEIKPIGIGKYNGFIIDNNHRFLLGDFTVTHNSGKAKHSTNGRSIKGLKERIGGKYGQIRSNLMGKRVEQSGRTVIGPDPTLKMGQLAVPPEMADNLTVPVQVTNFNQKMLTDIVNNGGANFVLKDNGNTRINLQNALFFRGTILHHGDIIIRKDKNGNETENVVNNGKDMLKPGDKLKRNGEFINELKYPEKRVYHLNIGDIVERKLINGDIVLLNRQPTKLLH